MPNVTVTLREKIESQKGHDLVQRRLADYGRRLEDIESAILTQSSKSYGWSSNSDVGLTVHFADGVSLYITDPVEVNLFTDAINAQQQRNTAHVAIADLPEPSGYIPIPLDTYCATSCSSEKESIVSDSSNTFDFGAFLADKFHSGSNKQVSTGVYTGALETYSLQPEMLKVVLNAKGKPIAVIAGEQVLPFEPISVTDSLAKTYIEQYAKGYQGRLTHVKGERPKARK